MCQICASLRYVHLETLSIAFMAVMLDTMSERDMHNLLSIALKEYAHRSSELLGTNPDTITESEWEHAAQEVYRCLKLTYIESNKKFPKQRD